MAGIVGGVIDWIGKGAMRKKAKPTKKKVSKPDGKKPNMPSVTKWDDSKYEELRKQIRREPLDAIRMVQEILLTLKSEMYAKRFSSPAFAFAQASDIMLNQAIEMASMGYFEVVQDIFTRLPGVLENAQPWGSLENITRNSIEQFEEFPTKDDISRTPGELPCEALSWSHPDLGTVWSEITYSGSHDNIDKENTVDPYAWDDPTKRFCLDESIHRHFGLHYLGIRSPDKNKPPIIARYSWHCSIKTKNKLVLAYYPQGHSRSALVKRFVVMLVHGVFLKNGQKFEFCWVDFPPTREAFWNYLGIPAIRPRCGDVEEWKKRICGFLRVAVANPEELDVFRTMLRLNEATFAKGVTKEGAKVRLAEDKVGYQWNVIDREVKNALDWYFKVLRSLPNQNLVTFD